MSEPPQDKNLNHLHPLFRRPLQAWLADLAGLGQQVQIYETFRTPARQLYLYSLGRTARNPNTPPGRSGLGSMVTYTIDSLHRYGAACDLMPVVDGRGTFDLAAYAHLYALLPLRLYGLETLDFERPHVQLIGGQTACQRLGIRRDVLVGSVWPERATPAPLPAPALPVPVKPAPAKPAPIVVRPAAHAADPDLARVTLVDMAQRDVQLLDERAIFGGVLVERLPGGVRLTRAPAKP